MAAEVEGSKSGLPEKAAVMECVPTASAVTVRPGLNAWLMGMIPSGVVPSKNVTDPLDSTNGAGVTVNVTRAPCGALACDEDTVMEDGAGLTTTVAGAELLGPFVASPR